MKATFFFGIVVTVFFACSFFSYAESSQEILPQLSEDFVEIGQFDGLTTDIRYATTNNFVGKNLYKNFNKPFLHKIAAEKLKKAAENLQKEKPGWKLLVFDALRPRAIQRKLWENVVGTEKQKYVANPDKGSIHNYGFAVDLSLKNEKGEEVDMGTAYDSFEDLAQPSLEEKFLKNGKLTQVQVDNRKILRKVMTEAGFIQLPLEWWHYDALPGKELKKLYKIVE